MALSGEKTALLRRSEDPAGRVETSPFDSINADLVQLSIDSQPLQPESQQYIIAIDFGTTYSSVAYASVPCLPSGDPRLRAYVSNRMLLQLNAVKTYPDGKSSHQEYQVPTVCMFNEREFIWGYSVSKAKIRLENEYRKADKLELVKLLLSDTPETRGIRKDLETKLKSSRVNATEVVARFLRELWQNALKSLKVESDFDQSPKTLVLSMPASYNQASVRLMEEAARSAGLPDNFEIVSEPEAAAALLLREHRDEAWFHRGNTFLVVDLGGGTVDTIALTSVQNDPLIVDEAAPSTGSLCGARFVVKNFEEWLKAQLELAKKRYRCNNWEEKKQALVDLAVKSFEPAMRDFTGEDTHAELIEVPGIRHNGKSVQRDGILRVTRDDMCSFFDPVIDDKIIPLIELEICAAHDKAKKPLDSPHIKCILLVGGFSGSEYLQQRITNFFETPCENRRIPYGIKVRNSRVDHSTIVARGAVLLHLNRDFVRKRLLRSSYGFGWDQIYKEELHGPDAPVELDVHEKDLRVKNCIKWIIKAGDTVTNNTWISGEGDMHWTVDENFDFKSKDSGSELFCELYFSDSKNPKDGQTKEKMRETNQHLELWGTVRADTTNADTTKLKVTRTRNRKGYYKIPYRMRLRLQGLETSWDLIIPDLPDAKSDCVRKNIRAAVAFQAESSNKDNF